MNVTRHSFTLLLLTAALLSDTCVAGGRVQLELAVEQRVPITARL